MISASSISELDLWKRIAGKRKLLSLDLEITARCNNNCSHCYINLPEEDNEARDREISLPEIDKITNDAAKLGALFCLLTGGEPLLRKDFFDIYLNLKKKGFLISVFTNATLITKKHIEFFKKYPPRNFEVSVYGINKKTYERVTRTPGSFQAFLRGLKLLLLSGIKVRFKTMALRSNISEIKEIANFCRENTKDYYRFDPFLHLRYDRDQKKNKEIISQRLSPQEIINLEQSDPERFQALEQNCHNLLLPGNNNLTCQHLFLCGAGKSSCIVSYDGLFRLCYPLWHPDTIYDLRKGNLKDAFLNFVPKVLDIRSDQADYLEKCRDCPIVNLCMWCPAYAFLETGYLDKWVEYFCNVAHRRAEMLQLKPRS